MQLVLFDIDGTLLDSGGCGRAATRLAMQEVFDTTGTLDTVNFAGKTDWQILLESLESAGLSTQHVQAQREWYHLVMARHLTQIAGQFPITPCVGAREVVTALRKHPQAVVGLVTGNAAALVPIKLRAAGYDPADFKVGAYGSEGWDRSMLPPLALSRARAYSGVSFAPEQIVIIGDTPGDITCAASIGARTIAVATGPYSVPQLREFRPDHVFETMADTQAVLSAIFENNHAD
jgi:phosphoglycolate phosphatase